MLSTHHDQTQEKPEIDKTLFKLPHQQLRIPVSNYYHTQRLENEKNNDKKKVGSLFTYIRFANRYSCERFDTAYTKENYDKTLEFIDIY